MKQYFLVRDAPDLWDKVHGEPPLKMYDSAAALMIPGSRPYLNPGRMFLQASSSSHTHEFLMLSSYADKSAGPYRAEKYKPRSDT